MIKNFAKICHQSNYSSEIQHISDWATANNLKLNNSKSQEMIVHLPRRRKSFLNPSAIPGIKRVDKMNILGITVSHTLTFHHHILALATKCARSFFALNPRIARLFCKHLMLRGGWNPPPPSSQLGM